MLSTPIGKCKSLSGLAAGLLLLGGAVALPLDEPARPADKPFDLKKRVPLTTSKVAGSPEPPPPYRVKRLYPNFKINFPIAVRHQPGSDRLWFITQGHAYGRTDIHRMKDDPNTKEFETLLKLDGTAYDIAFHPKFADNGYVYIGWNGLESGKPEDRKTKVTRYTVDGSVGGRGQRHAPSAEMTRYAVDGSVGGRGQRPAPSAEVSFSLPRRL